MTYRTATLDDAELAADIMTAAYPAMAQDPVMTRMRWASPRRGFAYGRFIVEERAQPIAFVVWVHGPWSQVPDRHCEVGAWLDERAQGRGLYEAMWGWIEEKARSEDPALMFAFIAEDEHESMAAPAALGYERKRTGRMWELDLKAHGARLVDEARSARQRMAEAGIAWSRWRRGATRTESGSCTS